MGPGRTLLEELVGRSGVSLTAEQLDQLWTYHRLLRAANSALNLTRIHNFENMVLKHYVDSLLVLRFVTLPSPLVPAKSAPARPWPPSLRPAPLTRPPAPGVAVRVP